MRTRPVISWGLVLATALALGAREATAQAPPVAPESPRAPGGPGSGLGFGPGGRESHLGPAPGEGGSPLGNAPGQGADVLGGHAGTGTPRVPPSIAEPGGGRTPPARRGMA